MINFEINTKRKQIEDELLNYKDKLEELVKERTAEVEKVNEELKKSEDKYRTILENIEDGYYEVDLKGNFTFFNESMRRILGYSHEEMMGMNNREYMDEKNAKKVLNTFNTVFKTGNPSKTFDWELIKKNGDICYIETSITLIRDSDKKPIGFRGVARDVTEKKHSEAALKKSEEKYRNIVENIEEGYFEVDLKGNLNFFNDSLCRIVRLSREDLLGMNNREYTTPETAKKMFNTFNEVYRTGESVNLVDYEVVGRDGSKLILSLSVSLLSDDEGNPIGFRGIVRDVSFRRQAEQEKRKLEEQLNQAQKMESIGTLAGGIAHDFNNLLMSIQGKISIMLFHMNEGNKNYNKLRDIEEYIKNGADLTRQLLGFARGGKYEVKPTKLNELIESTSKMFGGTKKEIKIHKNYEPELMRVDVDQGQIS
ncbi:MAG: PAS domain S-box protein, partial [Desulfobacterales bacterium]|nr:PAS domain S-box protein [Desulfobacterales bacterium]